MCKNVNAIVFIISKGPLVNALFYGPAAVSLFVFGSHTPHTHVNLKQEHTALVEYCIGWPSRKL